jgi:hypothetical protein
MALWVKSKNLFYFQEAKERQLFGKSEYAAFHNRLKLLI